LLQRIQANPEQFTPNVLLRPVVQDFLLPSIAYAGGPAEVAYFAQAAVVYERLLGRLTPVLPRFSATLVDARAKRLLQKYGMTLENLFHGPETVREEVAARSLPDNLRSGFEDATKALEQALQAVVPPLTRLDPTLVGAADRAAISTRAVEKARGRRGNSKGRVDFAPRGAPQHIAVSPQGSSRTRDHRRFFPSAVRGGKCFGNTPGSGIKRLSGSPDHLFGVIVQYDAAHGEAEEV
jgi:hypothetical protein